MAEEIDREADRRARIVQAAATAVGQWLQDKRLLEKQIWQLRMTELESIVDVAMSAFIIEQSRQAQEPDAPQRAENSYSEG